MTKKAKDNREVQYLDLPKKTYHLKGMLLDHSDPKSVIRKGRIWVDGIEVLPELAKAVRPFYECWFEWGESGASGGFTAALAICLAIFKDERLAENIFVCFYEDFVQHFADGDFEGTVDLTDFLAKYQSRFRPHLYSRFCPSSLLNSREILMHKDPVSGEITANLLENYAMNTEIVKDDPLRKLYERKQKLLFKLFVKDRNMIKGWDFEKVVHEAKEILSSHYWGSFEEVLKRQFF